MLILELKAPFAACRPMAAGWYRPTATMLTHSAAYGLLLNVACVETRLREEEKSHPGRIPSSLTRPDLPQVRLAIGIPEASPAPQVQTIFQQLHNYPVGKDAGVPAEWTKGSKNNISPVRREFLSNLHVVVCMDGNDELETRIRQGLAGAFNDQRYGLPFVGDNAFLIDRLAERDPSKIPGCRWYQLVKENSDSEQVPTTTRLTTWIDRQDMTKTKSDLFAPTSEISSTIPKEAWQWIPPQVN
ncbi:CRISPR-associated protein DevS [Planctomycetales bacterium 10988]|nr:CRISPR-associated protein DevS [Planctomycetales bacterium 10988]